MAFAALARDGVQHGELCYCYFVMYVFLRWNSIYCKSNMQYYTYERKTTFAFLCHCYFSQLCPFVIFGYLYDYFAASVSLQWPVICSSVNVTYLPLCRWLWFRRARKACWLVFHKMRLHAEGHPSIFSILHLTCYVLELNLFLAYCVVW